MPKRQSLILSHAFLQGIAPAPIALWEPGGRPVRFAPGILHARKSDPATGFYRLRRGQVDLERAGQTGEDLPPLGPGDALGWSWLFPLFRWHFTCPAVDEVKALEWNTSQLRELAEKHLRMGYELARRLSQVLLRRLQAIHQQLVGFYGQG